MSLSNKPQKKDDFVMPTQEVSTNRFSGFLRWQAYCLSIALILSGLWGLAQITRDFVPLKSLEKSKYSQLDKNKARDTIFVSKYEVSNNQYRSFLNHLLATGQTEKYTSYRCDSLRWSTIFKYTSGDPMMEYYHSHPAFGKYPVVNITQEAAQAYCAWQTENYNLQPERQFNKVVFRLPLEWEWIFAAYPLPNHTLPWYGTLPYTNPIGKPALCNIKYHDYYEIEKDDAANYDGDGYPYTVPVKAYAPNRRGLYNVIGNVAEMTASGKIKGGSWDSFLADCAVNKLQTYSLPDPRVGFRVLMQVIEK